MNSGYVVWKDNKVVIFFSNELENTPPVYVLSCHEADVVRCVRGLVYIRRWNDEDIMRRRVLHVPGITCTFNIFMNSVYKTDHLRSTTLTRRREKRI